MVIEYMPVSTEDQARLETWENMQYDPATGEAIVNNLHTGWFFAINPTQSLPTPGQPLDGPRTPQPVSPWGFLSDTSASNLRNLILPKLYNTNISLLIGVGDPNTQFPQSVQPYELQFTSRDTPGKLYRFNAGLLASQIARTTNYDPVLKEAHQTTEAPINDLLTELNSQISAEMTAT